MTRGFITIATGTDWYYQLAENLLLSYRLFSENPMPFAILCDRENEHTKCFDQTIVFTPTGKPYFDKFELLRLAPFDETIFIDADCLAYRDLNEFWDFFAGADDFSGAGYNVPTDSDRGLFQFDTIGDFQPRVHWKSSISGGLYFIRRGAICDAIYEDCQKIIERYDTIVWPDFCVRYADEPVLCLAMDANGCKAKPAAPENYGYPWEVTSLKCDLFTGLCRYATEWHPETDRGRMIHWSTRYTKKPLYRFEAEKLHLMVKNNLRPSPSGVPLGLKDTIAYRWRLRYVWLLAWEFTRRAVNKLYRIVTRTPPKD